MKPHIVQSLVLSVQSRQIHTDRKVDWWLPGSGMMGRNGEWLLIGIEFPAVQKCEIDCGDCTIP